MMMSTFFPAWKLFWSSWTKDWTTQQKIIAQIGTHFEGGIPMVQTLMWNIITFTMLQVGLVHVAGFSTEFRQWCWLWVHLPCLIGSVAYYCFKYGWEECWNSLTLSALMKWIKNWIAMQGIALCCLSQTTIFYFIAILLQPFVLPESWQYSMQFPAEMYEEYLRISVHYFAVMFVILFATLPLWKRGYELSMEVAKRKRITITYQELVMELMYQTVQSGVLTFSLYPILLTLQELVGFRVYLIHILVSLLEVGLLNYTVQYKFCIMHQLCHEVKPLYAMTHAEHHVCKTTFPTTCAGGVWDSWINGEGLITTPVGLATPPWVGLQLFYAGPNIVAHTMWPSKYLLQWHTLHHTMSSDIYNINIPSPYDMENSKSVAKLHDKLKEVSPFVRYEFLSDLASLIIMIAIGVFFHYGLEIGATHIDWSRADFVLHNYSSMVDTAIM